MNLNEMTDYSMYNTFIFYFFFLMYRVFTKIDLFKSIFNIIFKLLTLMIYSFIVNHLKFITPVYSDRWKLYAS